MTQKMSNEVNEVSGEGKPRRPPGTEAGFHPGCGGPQGEDVGLRESPARRVAQPSGRPWETPSDPARCPLLLLLLGPPLLHLPGRQLAWRVPAAQPPPCVGALLLLPLGAQSHLAGPRGSGPSSSLCPPPPRVGLQLVGETVFTWSTLCGLLLWPPAGVLGEHQAGRLWEYPAAGRVPLRLVTRSLPGSAAGLGLWERGWVTSAWAVGVSGGGISPAGSHGDTRGERQTR